MKQKIALIINLLFFLVRKFRILTDVIMHAWHFPSFAVRWTGFSLQVCEARVRVRGCKEGNRAGTGNAQLNCVAPLQIAPNNLLFHHAGNFEFIQTQYVGENFQAGFRTDF